MEFLILTDIHDSWTHLKKMLQLAEQMDGVIFLGDLMKFRKFTEESIENLTLIKEASNLMVGLPGNGAVVQVRDMFDSLRINLHCKGIIIEDTGFFGIGGVPTTVQTISDIREFFKTQDTSGIPPNSKAMETWNAFGIFYENGRFVVEDWTDSDLAKMSRYTSPFEHSEEQIDDILSTAYEQIKGASLKIMLSHVPPYESGTISAFPLGVSTGSKALSEFIIEHDVDLSLSGHNHQNYTFYIENTECIVVPAVLNGYYGVLSVDNDSENLSTEICEF
ncbi:MAG: metallophosphoesterase [Candidatus Thorarchaeota archaeon]